MEDVFLYGRYRREFWIAKKKIGVSFGLVA
jgi:hypothetical protein